MAGMRMAAGGAGVDAAGMARMRAMMQMAPAGAAAPAAAAAVP
jgi:hypothetical protein